MSLSLLNSEGHILRTIEANGEEYAIHLPFFRGDRNEQFKIQLNWQKYQVEESFVI